jgi:hypothetical protein
MLAQVVIGGGVLLVFISLFAESLGLGRRQILGVVVGALVVLVGAFLWMPEEDEPPS